MEGPASKPYYDYEHGRWLCACESDAHDCMQKQEGEEVWLYGRDATGKMVNLRMYWSPRMPDKNRLKAISGGRVV